MVFPDWDAIFSYIRSYKNKRVIIACDEFPYLVNEDPSLLSVIQYHWVTWLKDSHLFLIVCGSSISMMVEMTMRYESPLFGRRTGQYLIKPLRFTDILEHFPDFNTAVKHYAVFGGTRHIYSKRKRIKTFMRILSPEFCQKTRYCSGIQNLFSCQRYQNPDIISQSFVQLLKEIQRRQKYPR